MSSPSSSSSGTGASRSPRRSRRSVLSRAAAALAAAAAVGAPLSVFVSESGKPAWTCVWVAVLATGLWLASRPGPRRTVLLTYGTGLVLDAGALAGAALVFLFTGCESDNGHVDPWMWAVGLAVVAAGNAWAVQRPLRTWWGMPVAAFAGLAVTALLALAVNGSTGACPE